MTGLPQAAIDAAAVAIHDAECPDTKCGGSALGSAYRLARIALAAGGAHIAAAERDRIRQLATDRNARYIPGCGPGCPGGHQTTAPFAELLTDLEGGHADGT